MVIVFALIALLLAGGAAAGVWFFMKSKAPAAAAAEEHAAKPEPVSAPSYLPLETMVVNLADPGGERFAQLGITIELVDEKAGDKIKAFLPSVRSSILLLVSQRSSEELLTIKGKEKLANDIAIEVARPLGFAEEMQAHAKAVAQAAQAAASGIEVVVPKRAASKDGNPVRGVLFSSFIIQ
jgi:flagellar FliL protein